MHSVPPLAAAPRFQDSQVRRAHDRGLRETDWLLARYSFSFGDYHDPNHTHWGCLRALNEDWVAPGRGFTWHGHRDIETLTYPLEGRIRHVDDLGNDFEIGPGDVVHMSAGSGINHSELNASATLPERHLQIWLYPRARSATPACSVTRIDSKAKKNRWCVVASPDGREGSITIDQDVLVFAARPAPGVSLRYGLSSRRLGYLHVVHGEILVGSSLRLHAGDGLKLAHDEVLSLTGVVPETEVLLFDL